MSDFRIEYKDWLKQPASVNGQGTILWQNPSKAVDTPLLNMSAEEREARVQTTIPAHSSLHILGYRSHNHEDFALVMSPDGTVGWMKVGELLEPRAPKEAEHQINFETFAQLHLGKPYIWADIGIYGWDCSSLVQAYYKQCCGLLLPRNANSQTRTCYPKLDIITQSSKADFLSAQRAVQECAEKTGTGIGIIACKDKHTNRAYHIGLYHITANGVEILDATESRGVVVRHLAQFVNACHGPGNVEIFSGFVIGVPHVGVET